MTATKKNTLFMGIACYKDWQKRTYAFRKSANDYEIPIVITDIGIPWNYAFHHKIKRRYDYIKSLKKQNKIQYVFCLDTRDIVFVSHVDRLLFQFNKINTGKVIFNQDVGQLYPARMNQPYWNNAIEEATGCKHFWLNSGAYCGNIDIVLEMLHNAAMLWTETWKSPRTVIQKELYRLQKDSWIPKKTDQVPLQLCSIYYPHLFALDYCKEVFAMLTDFPADINMHLSYPECIADPGFFSVINNASIVHAPGLAFIEGRKNEEQGRQWTEWVNNKKWEREVSYENTN